MSYKHGVYGMNEETYEATSIAQGTIPAYIGSLPVHRINTTGESGFDYSAYVNKPILISSLREAREMGLYSDNWNAYTLCEAIHAHFMNGEESVAPIIVVNTLDPENAKHMDAASATIALNRMGNKYVGTHKDPLCVIDDISITVNDGGEAVNVSSTKYYYNGDEVVIEVEVEVAEGNLGYPNLDCEISCCQINYGADLITATDFQTALDSLDYCEQTIGVIPNIVLAPGISENPEFYALLCQKAMDKIAGKWNFVGLADIPAATNKTYESSKAWKTANGYNSKLCKPYWPSFGYGDKTYHGSTIGAYAMQNIDTKNSDVPYVSTSNKEIFCDRAVVGDGETLLISEQKANELNKVGITTANIINRTLRLWGAHMGNYDYDKLGSIAPEDRFDTTVRMSMFILNYLQNQYINEIDESFTRKDIDSIVNSIQTWLDSLVNDGMLLSASVSFNNESNSDEAIANGDFVFDLRVTYGVTAKSITFKLQYSNKGIATLIGGDE